MSQFISLLELAVPATTPLLLACLGEIFSERSGVLNLGIEGLMSIGALAAIVVVLSGGGLWTGVLISVLVAGIGSLVFAVLTISLKSDQVVSGVMIALLGVAVANFYGNSWSGETISTFSQRKLPLIGDFLASIPVVGELLFMNTPLDYLAIFLVAVSWYILFRTKLGLKITAAGNESKAADTMGIDPIKIRYITVLVSGLLAGLAGASLSLGFTGYWTANLIDSRGWIAIAIVIVARWDPLKAIIGAFAFGFTYSLQFGLQGFNYQNLPLSDALSGAYAFFFDPIIISTYPFVVTIAMLVFFSIGTNTNLVAPQELAKNYIREGE